MQIEAFRCTVYMKFSQGAVVKLIPFSKLFSSGRTFLGLIPLGWVSLGMGWVGAIEPAAASGYCDGKLQGQTLQGQHICQFPSGLKYEGRFVNGKRDGKGKLTFSDGSTCEGGFENDVLKGPATCRYNSGNRYEGPLEDNLRQGQGKFIYANGVVCEGMFKNDAIVGVGICLYPNGNRYEGNFWQNQPLGPGTLTYADGTKCEGTFQQEQLLESDAVR